MPNVTVPKDFFVKERRMYSNWQFAFWRELFQNSVDAGCRCIRVSLAKVDDLIEISFDDDGRGMTRDVLENVYFRLGASTKNDASSVGGFGRARILTCFSMEKYSIHTLDNIVEGNGGEYEVKTGEFRRGCLLQVSISGENFEHILNSLRTYLGLSQLSCEVYVNDEKWRTWSYRRQLTRSLDTINGSFASVYVNKSAASNLLLIRVNGTVMYYQSIGAKAQVIVEVNPSLSRSVLTANRDGMHSEYSSVLSSFLQELAVETTTALLPKVRKKSGTVRGSGLLHSFSKVAKKAPSQKIEGETVAIPGVFGLPDKNLINNVDLNLIIRNIEPKESPVIEPKKPGIGDPFVSDLPDVFIVDETEIPSIRKVIDQYDPRNWVVCETQGKLYNKGGTLYKLLLLWKVACEGAIESLMKFNTNIAKISWGIGWLFDENALARCMTIDGGNAMLLNPVDTEGKMKYSLRSKKDQKTLMAIAKHEVAHILEDFHNENFAATLTQIDCFYEEKEIFRKMQEALALA